jgi:hypothetical protein
MRKNLYFLHFSIYNNIILYLYTSLFSKNPSTHIYNPLFAHLFIFNEHAFLLNIFYQYVLKTPPGAFWGTFK